MLQGSSTRVNTKPRSHPPKISIAIKQLGGENTRAFDGVHGVTLRLSLLIMTKLQHTAEAFKQKYLSHSPPPCTSYL